MGKVMEKLKESNPGRVDDFKKNATVAVKKVNLLAMLLSLIYDLATKMP